MLSPILCCVDVLPVTDFFIFILFIYLFLFIYLIVFWRAQTKTTSSHSLSRSEPTLLQVFLWQIFNGFEERIPMLTHFHGWYFQKVWSEYPHIEWVSCRSDDGYSWQSALQRAHFSSLHLPWNRYGHNDCFGTGLSDEWVVLLCLFVQLGGTVDAIGLFTAFGSKYHLKS